MTNQVRRVTVPVLGEHYQLLSDESEQTLHEAAHLVEQILTEIRRKAQGLTSFEDRHLAALASLRFVLSHNAREREYQQRLKSLVEIIDQVATEVL